jgi:hypothetical protein
MKLSDIELNDRQCAALLRWIDELAHEHDTRDRALAQRLLDEQSAEAESERVYTVLCELASDTARQCGPCFGLTPHTLAMGAWNDLIACEGYYSRYDVGDNWNPTADDCDTWCFTFERVIESLRSEAQ